MMQKELYCYDIIHWHYNAISYKRLDLTKPKFIKNKMIKTI